MGTSRPGHREAAGLLAPGPQPLIGSSAAMERLRDVIARLGPRRCTVLIRGESGTGKELVARHLHALSTRSAGPFVPVDCTNLSDTLIESQLFGHERGAFTGASEATLGFIRAADGGTLFLDEIGELPITAQAKLLRCIQERVVVPLGSATPRPVDVRIIAATHRDLGHMTRSGHFRQDLYYRLQVAQLETPPLRERRNDIPPLMEHFLLVQAELYEEPPRRFDDDAAGLMLAYAWPGNVRELANTVEHAYVFSPDPVICATYLPDQVRAARGTDALRGSAAADEVIPLHLAERELILRALEQTDGCQAEAARLLHIERRRLYRKIRKYGLQRELKSLRSRRSAAV